MRFVISQQGGGRYAVIDVRSGQIRYLGSLIGARNAQASLSRSVAVDGIGRGVVDFGDFLDLMPAGMFDYRRPDRY